MRARIITVATLLAVGTVLGGASQAIADGGGDDGPSAVGNAQNSPGLLSGNNIQVPVEVGIPICGNSINVVGLLNPATGQCETN
ncbi:chaplin [Streptomyces flavofungini]|uniref:chaplin n=1 Tax=Streptomyces flavofungini TaxID=68200 RepID=UPI0034DE7FFF